MKRKIILLALASLSLTGCEFEVPLTTDHVVPIDKNILGIWQLVPEEGEEPDLNERMLIVGFSDTEYLIRYPLNDDAMYIRAYPVKVGGIHCVQVELIGREDGSTEGMEKEKYCLFSYTSDGDKLTIKDVNTFLVDTGIKSSSELREVFLKHKDDKDLFVDPDDFTRIEKKDDELEEGDSK